jgi:tetratricopeptide (TPR) repeat protein
MRSAYGGRAAAYEKKGDYQKALADHNLVVLFYAIEIEILKNLESADLEKRLQETSQAYSARGECLAALGRQKAAQVDQKRAASLEAEAKRLAQKSPSSQEPSSRQIQFVNNWTEALTVVIDGVPYLLDVGDRKVIPVSAGFVAYTMQAGTRRQSGTVEAGRTYTIGSSSR